jgi:hypothetical protein
VPAHSIAGRMCAARNRERLTSASIPG